MWTGHSSEILPEHDIDVLFELDTQTLLDADDTHEVLSLSDTASVELMTSVDNWAGIAMEHVNGAYLARITAQSGLIHDYKFRVNGRWCTAIGITVAVSAIEGDSDRLRGAATPM